MQKITVLLADDHTVVRQGLRALLEAEEDMNVAGEAENGRQAVQMAKRLQPDVVVMDIAMPSLNGLEATRQISRESPKSKVLILSSYSDDEYVQQLTDAGASGYLVKQTAAQDLVTAIREARKGNAFFSAFLTPRYRSDTTTSNSPLCAPARPSSSVAANSTPISSRSKERWSNRAKDLSSSMISTRVMRSFPRDWPDTTLARGCRNSQRS